jgi:hypothetical protein
MHIWSDLEEAVTPARAKRIERLLTDQRELSRELWANHRVQDEVIAELALITDQTPEGIRRAMV